MIISGDTLALLMSKGLSGDDLVEIIRALDSDYQAMHITTVAPVDEQAVRRRERDRLRKQESRSADIPQKSADTPLSRPLSPQTPLTPTHTPKDITTGARRAARRCPESWQPKPETIDKLTAEGHTAGDLERALTRMRDHEFANPRTDWDATFRNWTRTDRDRKPTPRPTAFDAKQSNLQRAFDAADRVAASR